MRHALVAVVVMLALWVDLSTAQTIAAGWDICRVVRFDDSTARGEFNRLSEALEKSERHQAAVRAGADAVENLVKRLTAIQKTDLLGERLAAEKAARDASQAPELAGVQVKLSEYCLNRLQRSPGTFTDGLSTHMARLRRLTALPDDRLLIAFKADTDQINRDFGTPDAAARTIRTVLAGAH
jgi:hypothetical protein